MQVESLRGEFCSVVSTAEVIGLLNGEVDVDGR